VQNPDNAAVARLGVSAVQSDCRYSRLPGRGDVPRFRVNFSHSTHVYKTVVATFDAWMVLVARYQNNRMPIAVREHSVADNLSAIVDEARVVKYYVRARKNKTTQVERRTVVSQK
jgi:hypothetical protein